MKIIQWAYFWIQTRRQAGKHLCQRRIWGLSNFSTGLSTIKIGILSIIMSNSRIWRPRPRCSIRKNPRTELYIMGGISRRMRSGTASMVASATQIKPRCFLKQLHLKLVSRSPNISCSTWSLKSTNMSAIFQTIISPFLISCQAKDQK